MHWCLSEYESEAKLIAHNHGVNLTRLDNRKFIMPGLIDTHIHAPQYVFTGSGTDLQLLDWLENYTFPREAQFNNTRYATMAYNLAVDRVIHGGSTTASYYATIHLEASKILADVVEKRGQRALYIIYRFSLTWMKMWMKLLVLRRSTRVTLITPLYTMPMVY
ncbi:hypothetical protein K7432_015813 [Basidiobolus ranarum]|uniref:Amidohydrolase-related domain-containing protein n=1 Tax=Basidiobolus ranarum TaxID=34480 RepID=A0ABR2WFM2_9FUNG